MVKLERIALIFISSCRLF